jgi:bacillopeptidase F
MNQQLRHISISGIIAAAAVCLAAAFPAYAGEIGPQLNNVMDHMGADTRIPVIIRLENAMDIGTGNAGEVASSKLAELLKSNSRASQGLLRALLNAKGIQNIVSLWIINGFATELTSGDILDFANHSNVKSIVLDDTVFAPEVPQTAGDIQTTGIGWDNLGAIDAPELWSAGIDGTGVVVADMDTGVDIKHPDLSVSYRGGTNSWYDPNGQHLTPYDAGGHGTQVMGILTGGAGSGTPIGVAPGARWIAVKIFDDSGQASYSDIHLGYQWLLDPDGLPDTDDAPRLVNNSWGLSDAYGVCTSEFRQDVQILRAAGIAVVFSAGNNGPAGSTSESPANYPESFAVGAVGPDLTVAAFSSRGPSTCDGTVYPELTAPGVDIYTADKTFGGVYPNSYTNTSGTSFAAPHAAGAMALLLDAYPGAAVDVLEQALLESAFDVNGGGEDNAYGYGVVNAAAAAAGLSNPPGCVDADNDGYFASAGCGTLQDCNDANFAINPAASEVKRDGIDQNCNGYDLTIDILRAVYTISDDSLSVEAVSALGKAAALELMGYGPMSWDRKKNKWVISVRTVGGNPGKVIVRGIEGAASAVTTVETGGSTGGGKGKKN